MNDSLVSVIVPCYNQGEHLCECIESILASTYKNLEIIVVNDGSTDSRTLDALAHLNYEKTVVLNQENKGLPSARNAGIKHAKGKYILPVDADDMITPAFLGKAIKVLDENPNIGIVGGLTELFGDVNGLFELPKFDRSKFMLSNCLVCSHMFRKEDWERVGGYNSNMNLGLEDWDFWLSLIEIKRGVYQFDEVFLRYRKHGTTMIEGMSDNHRKEMLLRAIDNHPHLYRWHGNYRYYIETGKHSFRRRLLDVVLRILSSCIPYRPYRRAVRSLSSTVF